jgi:hypothetical protein
MATTEDIALPAAMALIRCDIADGTVAMLEVVPCDEALDPIPYLRRVIYEEATTTLTQGVGIRCNPCAPKHT